MFYNKASSSDRSMPGQLYSYLIFYSINVQKLIFDIWHTACPNKNLTIFTRKIYDFEWKFWKKKLEMQYNNKGLNFCLPFVPFKSMI